jgi:hypothetical protein
MCGNNVKDDSSDHITYFWSSNVQVLWSSHHLFCFLLFFSVIRGLTIAAVPWMIDLCNSRWIVFVEMVFKMNNEFCCHPCCCSSSVIIRHNPLQCTAIPFTYFWFRGTIPVADVFPWFVYAIITLETHPTMWQFWLQMLQPNMHQHSVLWKSDKPPILQYIHMNYYKTQSVMHRHWHYTV